MASPSSVRPDDPRSKKLDLLQAEHLAQVGYWYWDPKTDTAVWSEGIYRISGRDPSSPALNRKETGQFYTPESVERLEHTVAEALRDGTQYELDLEIIRPDGTNKWGRLRGEVVRDALGQVTQLRGTLQDITEWKRAEESLRESEEKFLRIFRNASVGMVMVSPDGRFIAANTAFCELLGYSEEELIDRTVQSITHPKDWSTFSHKFSQSFSSEEHYQKVEKRCLHKSGRIVWTESTGSLVRSHDGHPKYLVGEVLDITRRKEAEEGNLVVRKLFRISNDGILIFGNRGRKLLDANPQALKALGYSRRELRSLSPDRIFVDQKSLEQFFEALWRQPVHSDKRPSLVRIACRHKSGRIMGASLSASMILHSGEPAALAIVGEKFRRRRISDVVKNQAKLSGLLHAVTDLHTAHNCIKLWLRRVCKHAQLPVGHVRVLVPGLVGPRGKIDIWHIKRARVFDSVRHNPAWMALPEPFRSRVATTRMTEVIADLEQYPNFGRPELRSLKLHSAVAIPVGLDDTVEAVSEFFSPSRLEEDPLLVDILECLGRELGFRLRQHSMSLKLMKAQDDERRRLARELHDTTAQGLAMILLDLHLIEKESEALSTDARAALSQIIGLARRSLGEVRTFSYLLHPPMLEELGLLATLRIFLEGFGRRSGIQLDVELPDSLPRTTPDWEMAVFRFVQEGLTNVRRHSRSRTATVRFRTVGDLALLTVENEGATVPSLEEGGLPSERVGVGIGGMRERLRAFGGDAMLYSRDDMTVLEAKVRIG